MSSFNSLCWNMYMQVCFFVCVRMFIHMCVFAVVQIQVLVCVRTYMYLRSDVYVSLWGKIYQAWIFQFVQIVTETEDVICEFSRDQASFWDIYSFSFTDNMKINYYLHVEMKKVKQKKSRIQRNSKIYFTIRLQKWWIGKKWS